VHAFMISILFAAPGFLFADDCKIIDSKKTERVEGMILPDGGIVPIAKYQCASVMVRNSARGERLPRDIVVSATFTDANVDAKRIDGDRKRFNGGEIQQCFVCFQSDFPIEDIRCEFRKK